MDPIFASVFPAATLNHTTPTPVATPDLGFTTPGQNFDVITSPLIQKQHQPLSAAQLQVKRNISWSTATRFLSLAHISKVNFNTTEDTLRRVETTPRRIKTRDVEEAIEFLLSGEGSQGQSDDNWDLMDWYTLEVRSHFLEHVAPVLQMAWSEVYIAPLFALVTI